MIERDPVQIQRWQQRSRDRQRERARKGEGMLGKRKPIKPVSDKRADEKPERDRVRAAVLKRDGYKCRVAPFLPDSECFGEMNVHHLRKSSAMGGYTEENLIACCNGHNDWIENNPTEAEALGLVFR